VSRPRVVVLGGGMAGLVTAWELTQGDWRDRLSSVTVYQRGWRLGGKGASSRGSHDRIEEHGLHVLLGYYDATFRVLREVYDELDRPRTDPACPVATWQDAFVPSPDVGLADWDGEHWGRFVTRFSVTGTLPGEPGAEDRPLRPLEVAARSIRLLWDFHRSMSPAAAGVSLSGSPHPPATDLAALVRGAGLTALAAVLGAVDRAARTAADTRLATSTVDALTGVLAAWRDGIREVVTSDDAARRTWTLVDLVVTNLQGMLSDGLLSGRDWSDVDDLDYREWLTRHGAADETVESAILRGMYDLTFAYESGDRSRPRFSAGLGLQLAARMLFDHKGSIFWRMQAGMGEAVFAPLYQALAQRGVQFGLLHRLDRLTVGPGPSVEGIHLTRQADLADGRGSYDPLVRVDGLPCWPHRPLLEQLRADPGERAESHDWPGPGAGSLTLRAGEDFDVAVLAVSLGMVPHVAGELVRAEESWARMVEHVGTVATRAAQLWLTASEADLGWEGASGVTLSGFGATFDTWAWMSHLLARESWPGEDGPPRSLAYLCSALPEADARAGAPGVTAALSSFLDREAGSLVAGVRGPDGFRWDLLHDPEGRTGPERLGAQYVRANTDPSDRYVQSLPGSGRHRIAPGSTGFANLAVAGDWTACGLDAGCLEAATRSGVLAARAVLSGAVRGGGGP
jgi:uncharacterized protein with NAD-binding domain and iron-sulfur cluster